MLRVVTNCTPGDVLELGVRLLNVYEPVSVVCLFASLPDCILSGYTGARYANPSNFYLLIFFYTGGQLLTTCNIRHLLLDCTLSEGELGG